MTHRSSWAKGSRSRRRKRSHGRCQNRTSSGRRGTCCIQKKRGRASGPCGEVHHAKEEGVQFDLLTNPVEILTDENDWVTGMVVRKMELGEPDASGRRRPVEVEGSDYTIEVDTVIMSLGTSPNPLISSTTEGLQTNKWKCIIADESNGKTTKEGVYAGGDAVTGAATVILAMEAGKGRREGY